MTLRLSDLMMQFGCPYSGGVLTGPEAEYREADCLELHPSSAPSYCVIWVGGLMSLCPVSVTTATSHLTETRSLE